MPTEALIRSAIGGGKRLNKHENDNFFLDIHFFFSKINQKSGVLWSKKFPLISGEKKGA
ncbi:hypothetical protein MTBBW1_2380021 [Desulfamplus magnetovallimortis]|uniref:Uncharacterized protein n=1 Tax=Desulfamplus magnetovallimortis TaxID=1246637 RepID=A0A1W1HDX6_9BACT|nr:hypothetical protein MTBBW1_2380021 [Desulfamplus magnetovallimortis]